MTTKEMLFETALDLFAKKGFSATSIRAITKGAGVSVASFYNHFESKDELLQQMYDYYKSQYIKNSDMNQSYERILEQTGAIGLFEFIRDSIIASFKNEKIVNLSKIISMEQFISPAAREISTKDKQTLLSAMEQIFIMMSDKKLIHTKDPAATGRLIGYAYLGFASYNLNLSAEDRQTPCEKIKEQSKIILNLINDILISN